MRSVRAGLVILVACSTASFSARQDVVATATPSFALEIFVDELDVMVENGAGGLDVLIQIENVSDVEQVLPIIGDSWVRRIDVVEPVSGRSDVPDGRPRRQRHRLRCW